MVLVIQFHNMKKLLFILLFVFILTSCSKPKDNTKTINETKPTSVKTADEPTKSTPITSKKDGEIEWDETIIWP